MHVIVEIVRDMNEETFTKSVALGIHHRKFRGKIQIDVYYQSCGENNTRKETLQVMDFFEVQNNDKK